MPDLDDRNTYQGVWAIIPPFSHLAKAAGAWFRCNVAQVGRNRQIVWKARRGSESPFPTVTQHAQGVTAPDLGDGVGREACDQQALGQARELAGVGPVVGWIGEAVEVGVDVGHHA